MAQVEETSVMGRSRHQGISPVLQGDDTNGIYVWIVVLSDAGRNAEGGGVHPYGFPSSDHRKVGYASGRRGVGNTTGGGGIMGVMDAVGVQVHRPLASNGSAVNGPDLRTEGLLAGEHIPKGGRKR